MGEIISSIIAAVIKAVTTKETLAVFISWISGRMKWILLALAPASIVIAVCFWACSKPSAMILDITIPRNPIIQHAKFQAEGGEHLFNYFRPNYEEFKVRIENEHLKKEGCFHFVVIKKTDTDTTEEMTKIYPGFLKQAREHQGESSVKLVSVSNPDATLSLRYTHAGGTVHYPPSAICSATWNRASLNRLGAGFISEAFAQNQPEISTETLIESLKSENDLFRFEAQQILSTRGPRAIRSILKALAELDESSVEWKRLAVSTVGLLEEMLQGGVNPDRIRESLQNNLDLKPLVMMLDHPHPRTRYDAATSLLILNDFRAIPFLIDILESATTGDSGKYNAALVLIGFSDRLSDGEKKALRDAVEEVFRKYEVYSDDLEERTAELLNNIRDNTPATLSGWTYVGIFYDGSWVEKFYKWAGDSKPPKKDDVLEATGSVHARRDHIKFDLNTEQWVNADVVGLVHPGDKVRVDSVKNVADGFYWVKGTVVE